MPNAKTYVAILQATDGKLTVLEVPHDVDDIENWLQEYTDFDMSNCQWQEISGVDIRIIL